MLQSWDEHRENHDALLRYLDRDLSCQVVNPTMRNTASSTISGCPHPAEAVALPGGETGGGPKTVGIRSSHGRAAESPAPVVPLFVERLDVSVAEFCSRCLYFQSCGHGRRSAFRASPRRGSRPRAVAPGDVQVGHMGGEIYVGLWFQSRGQEFPRTSLIFS